MAAPIMPIHGRAQGNKSMVDENASSLGIRILASASSAPDRRASIYRPAWLCSGLNARSGPHGIATVAMSPTVMPLMFWLPSPMQTGVVWMIRHDAGYARILLGVGNITSTVLSPFWS
jgi:hypothetical protein